MAHVPSMRALAMPAWTPSACAALAQPEPWSCLTGNALSVPTPTTSPTVAAAAPSAGAAVAAVVNLVLTKTFEGFKGHAEFGDTDKDDHRVYKAELSWGTSFAGGRGHIILSGQHTMSGDTVFASSRDWWRPQALCPAGQSPTQSFASCGGGTPASPMCVRTYINGNSVFTQGGLITASAAAPPGTVVGVNGVTALAPANALKGLQFGPNGTVA